MRSVFALVVVCAMAFFGSAVFAQATTVTPFSGNLDRPTSTWEAEDAEEEMAPAPPPDPEEEEDPDDDDEEPGEPPTFMDEELEGANIVLCLDASCSMGSGFNPGYPVYGGGGGVIPYPNRWQAVQSEAAGCVGQMTEQHMFDMVVYDTPVQTCFGQLRAATPGVKQQAISWIYNRYTAG